MYNYASELADNLNKTIRRIVHWQNARCRVLDSVISQKLGLFHHRPFARVDDDDANVRLTFYPPLYPLFISFYYMQYLYITPRALDFWLEGC